MYHNLQDDDDTLRRSPGTPVFTAPECCQGLTYHGRAADTWAVGVTLYCMILGQYPFIGETLHETYDKIVKDPVEIPDGMNPQLVDLLERLLCKGYIALEVWNHAFGQCLFQTSYGVIQQQGVQSPISE
ncbi:serine/threonine-protein kinase GRIK1-like [Oryza brachyantha]|uniref:serine/threonine-protein kinase GRIK1-like n=1 Tax=Oryza brachyantha TaxID=4533 RepID=UPI0003EACEB4|nr:serine/threonine-protein kinase GRIK1-like [Oryza brachyantha]